MSAMCELDIELRAALQDIRDLQAAQQKWIDENQDLAGEDDAKWYDTISSYDEYLANAGIRLADVVEKLIGGSL